MRRVRSLLRILWCWWRLGRPVLLVRCAWCVPKRLLRIKPCDWAQAGLPTDSVCGRCRAIHFPEVDRVSCAVSSATAGRVRLISSSASRQLRPATAGAFAEKGTGNLAGAGSRCLAGPDGRSIRGAEHAWAGPAGGENLSVIGPGDWRRFFIWARSARGRRNGVSDKIRARVEKLK